MTQHIEEDLAQRTMISFDQAPLIVRLLTYERVAEAYKFDDYM